MTSSLWPVVLEGSGDPARLSSAAVTGSFFETLGARPALGRTLAPGDDDGALGRLRPGVGVDGVRDELASIAAGQTDPGQASVAPVVTPLLDHTLGPLRRGLRRDTRRGMAVRRLRRHA